MESFDVVIVGAGAAGLMCAMTAGNRGRRVLLLEHNDQAGAKILISGGGRCNFTNLEIAPERFLSANPHFCKSALSRYTQHDFIAMVERHRIRYHEKTLGQLFCDGSAREILGMLLAECAAAHVDLRTQHRVTDVVRTDRFRIETDKGSFTAPALVLATGGLSIPKMGASGFAYEIARRFDLDVIGPRPGLVPLKVTDETLELCKTLAGVSVDAIASCGRDSFRENILFTHRGLSGPAILQMSSYWQAGEAVIINMLPEIDVFAMLKAAKQAQPQKQLKSIMMAYLPKRVVEIFLNSLIAEKQISTIAQLQLQEVANTFNYWQVKPNGTEGYRTAEVTLGGVDCDAISSKTMAALNTPGLYFIGEVLDVTGWLGGYNFQWAWSSAWAAGQVV